MPHTVLKAYKFRNSGQDKPKKSEAKGSVVGTSEESSVNQVDVEVLLAAWSEGDVRARDRVFKLLYDQLNNLSGAILNGERQISLSTGDLVHEAAIRLCKIDRMSWRDRAHFLAMAARMMRRVLIDRARAKNADKRRHHAITLITDFRDQVEQIVRHDELEKALVRLKAASPDSAYIVELRYYGNLSIEETAEVVGMSPSGVKRKWRSARAWLFSVLRQDVDGSEFENPAPALD